MKDIERYQNSVDSALSTLNQTRSTLVDIEKLLPAYKREDIDKKAVFHIMRRGLRDVELMLLVLGIPNEERVIQ
jgi:hypothetical protein